MDSTCTFTDAEIGTDKITVRHLIYAVGSEGSQDKLRDTYDNISECYDKYADATYRVADRNLAEAIASVIKNKNARIIDVCAGTGLLGSQLKKLGFSEIDALDFSQGMLDIAKSKDIYKNYIRDSIRKDQKTQVDDDTYDVVCVSGGMMVGHLDPNDLQELTRMAKRGGIVAFNMTAHTQTHYPAYGTNSISALSQSFIADGRWLNLTNQTAPYYAPRLDDEKAGENGIIYIATVGQH